MENQRNSIERNEEFEKLARPLIKFLNDNYNPHASIYIKSMNAELSTGEMAFTTEDYLKD